MKDMKSLKDGIKRCERCVRERWAYLMSTATPTSSQFSYTRAQVPCTMQRSPSLRGSARSLRSGSATSRSGSMLHTHQGGEGGQRSDCGAGGEGQMRGAGGGEERRRGQQKRRAREQRAFSHPPLSPRPSRPPRGGSVPSDSHAQLRVRIRTHAHTRAHARRLLSCVPVSRGISSPSLML